MWESGLFRRPKGRSDEASFSNRLWGKTANEYVRGIIDLEERQWDAILTAAEQAMRGLDGDSDEDIDLDNKEEDAPDLMPPGRAAIDDDGQTQHEISMGMDIGPVA